MTSSIAARKVIVSCTECSAVFGAELYDDGTISPLGTEDDCSCGASTFRRLR